MEATGPQNATEIEGMRGQHGEEIEAQRRQMRSEMAEWSGRQQAEVEALKEAHAKVEQALRAERDKAAKDLARLKQHLLHIVRTADGWFLGWAAGVPCLTSLHGHIPCNKQHCSFARTQQEYSFYILPQH